MPCPLPSTSCRPSCRWPVSKNRRIGSSTVSTCRLSSSSKKLCPPGRSTGARFPTTAPVARPFATVTGNWSCNTPRPSPAPLPTNESSCSAWTRTWARKTTWLKRNRSGPPPCSSSSRQYAETQETATYQPGGWVPRPQSDVSFFNGKDLTGWSASEMKYWSVKDGAVMGHSAVKVPGNKFIWADGEVEDFYLTVEVKLTPDNRNAGIQFRSKKAKPPVRPSVTKPASGAGSGASSTTSMGGQAGLEQQHVGRSSPVVEPL